KRKSPLAHSNCMLGAFSASVVLPACYLYYHVHTGRAVFRNSAWSRPLYLTLLFTHTLLAVVIVPMILVTLDRAAKERLDQHKQIARWTWPLWMYVSVTGVLIYFLLYHLFPQR